MTTCEACGVEIKAGRRFCSWDCSSAWAQERSEKFGHAAKPPDGVTYGRGKKEGS